ncbi:hypothetical protein ACFFYR_39180 [Paraburkholderia dipogonis]|uniref:hypothetical protein n=1 Tax=Paraburkholderia dipogonis TaxID=1211383 RepID=UPI001FCB5ACE|nr:hypothetical protein [Paraburkholderia dipogonis]
MDFIVASGGWIQLTDPALQPCDFHYGGAGVGLPMERLLPTGITMPKFGLPQIKGHEFGGAGSSQDFLSAGAVWMTPAFAGKELCREDIRGATVYVDAGIGMVGGFGGSAMLLGINSVSLMMGIMNPALSGLAARALDEAPALLLMGGFTMGVQAGAGAGLMVGYLH